MKKTSALKLVICLSLLTACNSGTKNNTPGGKTAGPYATLAVAKTAGAITFNYGFFISTIVSFLIVAFSVFLLIKNINRFKKDEPATVTTKECPYCFSAIPLRATRCPHCTSEIKDA